MANNSDPNKYSKNKDIKPESALSNLAAVESRLDAHRADWYYHGNVSRWWLG